MEIHQHLRVGCRNLASMAWRSSRRRRPEINNRRESHGVSEERDGRVPPVLKREPNEHCARECESCRPIASSSRRDEEYSEWMLLARHYYVFDRALSVY